jgi:bacterial leucyl aminopeptidase
MKNSLAFSILTLFLSSVSALADSPLRLIQTDENTIQWMSASEVDALSHDRHEQGLCGGFMDITDTSEEEPLYLQPLGVLENRQPRQQEKVTKALPELSAKNLKEKVITYSSFPTRYYKSQKSLEAAHWLKNQFKEYAGSRNDIEVEFFGHSFVQPSIIARIKGHGPLSEEKVILGGHADSINSRELRWQGPDVRAPGADDNASGISTLLEIFRVLSHSGFRPQRTLEFMAYAGEEGGLLGSQDIANAYKRKHEKVAGVIQFDMTMFPGNGHEVTLITDHTNPALTDFLKILLNEYTQVPWSDGSCGYACSDHASWTRAGFAAAFPFEAPFSQMNRHIHTRNDLYQNGLEKEFGLFFAQLGLAFAIEMSLENESLLR